MLYKYKNKYYIKVSQKYIEVKPVMYNDNINLEPTYIALEQYDEEKIEEIKIDEVKKDLSRKYETKEKINDNEKPQKHIEGIHKY